MKQCPACCATYGDALAFCVADGMPLAAVSPPPGAPALAAPSSPARRPAPSRTALLIGLAGAVVVLLAVVAFLLLRPRPEETEAGGASAEVEPEPMPSLAEGGHEASRYARAATITDPDGYTNVRSRPSAGSAVVDEIREGEVFYTDEQPGDWWPVRSPRGSYGYVHASRIRLLASSTVAYAGSPGDGFLALRSRPSVREGERLLQIPHGAAVEMLGCDGPSDVADERVGTWCRVRYAGREGWAFSGFLVESEPEPKAARSAPAPSSAAEGQAHDPAQLRLVDGYLSRQATNDIPYLLRLYASHVRYYDRGWVGHDALADDKTDYFDRWPTRRNTLDGPVRTVAGPDGVATLRFAYRFSVSGGARHTDGRAWAELDLLPTADGYLIQGERGGVY